MPGLNRYTGLSVAVCEFPLATEEADDLLFVDGKAVGVVEAKPEGTTLSGIAEVEPAVLRSAFEGRLTQGQPLSLIAWGASREAVRRWLEPL